MIVALLVVAAGFLALLFYVMHLVRPKRVRLSARVLKLVEFNVEADGESKEPVKAAESGGRRDIPSRERAGARWW